MIYTVPMPNSSALRQSQASFRGTKGYLNPTGWHLIPKWTPEVLEKAFEELEKWFDADLTTNDVTRENVRRVYGKEVEERVYHGRSTVARKQHVREGETEEVEEREEHHSQLLAMSEEEFEKHLFDIGGEEFLRRYRGA
jgi:hypothetical protein